MRPKGSLLRDNRGALTALTIVIMVVFFALLALVIDLGRLFLVKSQLQNAADNCALSGARAFWPYNLPGGTATTPPDPSQATTTACNAATDNKADTQTLTTLPTGDVTVGIWDTSSNTFLPWSWPPPSIKTQGPAIRVPVKKTDSSNGAVAMTLANVFGISKVSVYGKATAYISCVGGWQKNSACAPNIPVCINPDALTTTSNMIQFNSDNTDNGGWTNLQGPGDNTSAEDLKNYLNGTLGTGDLKPGTEISLNNGVICSATKTLLQNASSWGLMAAVPGQTYYADPANNFPGVTAGTNTDVQDPNNIKTFTFPVCNVDKYNQYAAFGMVQGYLLMASSSPDKCVLLIQTVSKTSVACTGAYGGGDCFGGGVYAITDPKIVQ